jgi:hypothetical protein
MNILLLEISVRYSWFDTHTLLHYEVCIRYLLPYSDHLINTC